MIRIIITASLSPVDVDNLLNHVNLVFLSLTFSLNLFFPLLIAALSTTVKNHHHLFIDDSDYDIDWYMISMIVTMLHSFAQLAMTRRGLQFLSGSLLVQIVQ